MPFKILIDPDDPFFSRFRTFPAPFKDGIAQAVNLIAGDPIANSRVPTLPFATGGRLHEFHVYHEDNRFTIRFFFEVDIERSEVLITKATIQPHF